VSDILSVAGCGDGGAQPLSAATCSRGGDPSRYGLQMIDLWLNVQRSVDYNPTHAA
jgi:hypothetical protein